MLELAFVQLLVSGLTVAREVLALLQGPGSTLAPTGEMEMPFGAAATSGVMRDGSGASVGRALDREFMVHVIDETSQRLEALIEIQSASIIDEIRRQRTRDAVQDVQARAYSLRVLLNAQGVDSTIVSQMVIGTLMPLEVSLAKAKYALLDYGTPESWYFCHIVGSSALIAGYGYLGQTAAHIEHELLQEVRSVQERILDDIAQMRWRMNERLPWSDVPELLTLEGSERLLSLYSDTQTAFAAQPAAFDPAGFSVEQLRDRVDRLRDIVDVDALLRAEKEGKARAGALRVLQKRRDELERASR